MSGPIMVAIAGAPGSGKSTLAEALHAKTVLHSCVIPMDGFHLDNATLEERALLPRKGAPETFDLTGFRKLIAALRRGQAESFPIFDRSADKTVPDGGIVPRSTELALIEGNYLLLDEPEWSDLQTFWDASIWLDVPEPVLLSRLVERWTKHGLSNAEARDRAEQNDLVNARRVMKNRLEPTWELGIAACQQSS
ncbi:MAG: nucleoside/nucleotide kinase family protein [Pseudomonadota bacterium]